MAEFAARIGRVRMKNGGADVRILPQRNQPYAAEEDYRAAMVRNAHQMSEYGPLAGYIILAMYPDGKTAMGYRHDTKANIIPRALLPSWIAEVVRRDIIMDGQSRDVFDEMFKWQEG